MKKAIKKTCVVLLLFALLASQVAASYSETGTLNEGTSAISAAERYLSNWAYNSYMYADKNLTLGTVLDAEVDPAKLTLATSEFMALRNDADGQENNISVAVSKMQANIQFMIQGKWFQFGQRIFMMLPHVLGQTRHIHFLRPIPNVLVVVMFGHI